MTTGLVDMAEFLINLLLAVTSVVHHACQGSEGDISTTRQNVGVVGSDEYFRTFGLAVGRGVNALHQRLTATACLFSFGEILLHHVVNGFLVLNDLREDDGLDRKSVV